jgi:hypothetical protein
MSINLYWGAGAGAEVTASEFLLMLFELETYKLVVISKVN